jgi:hypothetical protein
VIEAAFFRAALEVRYRLQRYVPRVPSPKDVIEDAILSAVGLMSKRKRHQLDSRFTLLVEYGVRSLS